MERLLGRKSPKEKKPREDDVSSSSESQATGIFKSRRRRFWSRRKPGGLGMAQAATSVNNPDNHRPAVDAGRIVTEGPQAGSLGLSIVNTAKSPSISVTATPVAQPESATLATPPELTAMNNDSEAISNDCEKAAGLQDSTSLWDQGYEALRQEKPEVVEAYEELLSKMLSYLSDTPPTADLDDLLSKASNDGANMALARMPEVGTSRQKMMADAIALGHKHMEGKQIAFELGQQKFVLRDQMKHVVAGIQLGKDWIGDAVKASPLASVAWAAVCLLMPLLTNPSEVQAANEEGLAYVTQKMQYFTAMESLLLPRQHEEPEASLAAMTQAYRDRLIELYQAIIDFQVQSALRFFRRRFKNLVREFVKWDPWEEMLKNVKELGDNAEKMSLQINITLNRTALTQWARESKEDECLQSLKLGDYAWYKGRVKDRAPDTCLWFLNHASYQEWLKTDSGPLLVSADPGCGKSVLAKYLIDSGFGFSLPREVAMCYFFFKDGDQNTLKLALCALVHQLLCQRPQLMRHAVPRYKQDGPQLADNVTALWNILETAAADPDAGSILIVLDALDECLQDERNMGTLSRYVQTHFQTGPRNLKVLMTSRPYQGTIRHIQQLEKSFPNIRIKGEDDSVTISREINSVIEYRVDQMDKLNGDLRTHLKQRLKSNTHRTYLWFYLVFEYLESAAVKRTVRGLDKAIEHLPTTVDEAYEKILSRSTEPKETRKVMLILLAASRPLTLCEMQIATSVTLTTSGLEDLDLEPDDDFMHRLREWCGLFITVHDNKVYFLHQTAREFLLPLAATSLPCPTTTTVWGHTLDMGQANMLLAEACTVYLFHAQVHYDRKPENGFLDYSARNWTTHFRQAGIVDDAAIMPFAMGICNPNSTRYERWACIYWKDRQRPCDNSFTDLLVASYFGLKAVVKRLLNRGEANVNSRDQNGRTSLLWASGNGHEAVVKLLLARDEVDVNSKDWANFSPLSWAASNGHEAVVKLLLTRDEVDVNSKDRDNWTPLLWAIGNGHEAVVKLLLTRDEVDVNSKDRINGIPLLWATRDGHEAVVKLLLARDEVDVNSKDEANRTPLLWAARNGHEAVVKLLLARDEVDVNSKDEADRTPLLWAARNGHEAVVKLLQDSA